jgi:hypothetical protein
MSLSLLLYSIISLWIFSKLISTYLKIKTFSFALLTTGLMAVTANAQYTGFLFFEPRKCPADGQEEHSLLFTYSAKDGNSCFSQDYGSSSSNISVSGNLIGTNTKAPAKIGGCQTSTCDSGCQTADITTGTDGFTLDCAEFTDAPYIYLGN